MNYFDHPAINQSLLKTILKSEEEFKLASEEKFTPTPEMILGSAVHRLVLEPHLSHTLLVSPKIDGNTRLGKIWNFIVNEKKEEDFFFVFDKDRMPKGKKTKPKIDDKYVITPEEYDEMQEMKSKYEYLLKFEEDVILLNQDEYDKAHKMAAKIRKNTEVSLILKACHSFEKEYYWEYKGIPMKGKVDAEGFLANKEGYIIDIKTTSKPINLKNISFIINDFGYDFQCAHYLIGTQNKYFFIIFVSSKAPYVVYPFQISNKIINEGMEKLNIACEKYNYCLEHNPEFITDNKIQLV